MALPVSIADRAFRKLVAFLVAIFVVTLVVIVASANSGVPNSR